MKKTLMIKLGYDISATNEKQIEAIKAYWRATLEDALGMTLDFELIEEDDEATVERLLSLVRSEFKANDEQSVPQDKEPQ